MQERAAKPRRRCSAAGVLTLVLAACTATAVAAVGVVGVSVVSDSGPTLAGSTAIDRPASVFVERQPTPTASPESLAPVFSATPVEEPAAPAAPAAPALVALAPPCADLPATARRGGSGKDVAELKRCLEALGFRPGNANATRHAVIAFQKEQGLKRDGVLGSKTLAALRQAQPPAMPKACGDVVACADLKRQIIFIKDKGRLNVIDTATGNGERYQRVWRVNGTVRPIPGAYAVASTPRGKGTVCRKVKGHHKAALGSLFNPVFIDYEGDGRSCTGFAFHGSLSVPVKPASHGCLRVIRENDQWVFKALPRGAKVAVI